MDNGAGPSQVGRWPVLKLPLKLHPDSRSAVVRIDVDILRPAVNLLHLTYTVFGPLDQLIFLSTQPAARADELWKHSCFELFLSAEHGYYEFNFSPSSQWAAYRFDSYRKGMRDAPTMDPAIGWQAGQDQASLTATLQLPSDGIDRFGLSAIIEEQDGTRAFWALAHPPGAPDFHDAACFAAQLPPAG